MNITFTRTHMQTLMDLQELAKKHNCFIKFGFNSYTRTDIEEDVLKAHEFNDDIIKELCENQYCLSVSNIVSTEEKFWFELKDNDAHIVGSMVVLRQDTAFDINVDGVDENYEKYQEWLSENAYELDAICDEDDYHCDFGYAPTIIRGFGNKTPVVDYRVYRDDMALKFFGDLVCDYFKEPRINRVYD